MNANELINELNKIVEAGHGTNIILDADNPEFEITRIAERRYIDANGDDAIQYYFEVDEVKR